MLAKLGDGYLFYEFLKLLHSRLLVNVCSFYVVLRWNVTYTFTHFNVL